MTHLLLTNAQILTADGSLLFGALWCRDGKIAGFAALPPAELPPETVVIDAQRQTVVPGFIDLQLNGAFGLDFTQEPEAIWKVAARLPCYGITAFLPTIITAPLTTVAQAQAVLSQRPSNFQGATPLGLHLEGPYLNPQKKGAHNPAFMRRPNVAETADWSPEQHVRLVTLAPELDGALDLSAALAARGLVVSAGHSMATTAQARAGFDAGIRYGTHLFNAMPPLHHRRPGLAGALLADERPVFGLILDRIHVHPDLVKLAWQAAGDRLNLVSDAMAALGTAPGRYALGSHEVTVDETSARLDDGTLAGALLSPDTAVRHLLAITGCTLAEAMRTVTQTPARLLGIQASKGRLVPGSDADLVLLDAAHNVTLTICGGAVTYDSSRSPQSH